MRQAINENRTVQLALLGLLALAAGLFLLKSTKGSGSETAAAPAPAPAEAAVPATTAAPTSVPADGAAATATATGIPVELIPGPGLPKALTRAWKRGDAVALLVRRDGGIDDRLVRTSVEGLRALSKVEVFVTPARRVARYAWLTQGVNLNQLPALVVLSPGSRKGAPSASVDYGFRNGDGVVQAVEDALYKGPERSYHP